MQYCEETYTRHQPDNGADGQFRGGIVPVPSQDEVLVIVLRSGLVVDSSLLAFVEVARLLELIRTSCDLPASALSSRQSNAGYVRASYIPDRTPAGRSSIAYCVVVDKNMMVKCLSKIWKTVKREGLSSTNECEVWSKEEKNERWVRDEQTCEVPGRKTRDKLRRYKTPRYILSSLANVKNSNEIPALKLTSVKVGRVFVYACF